ncbi:response regulator [Luteibacter sp.]|uniref:response regulator n=1 Tax=Luteibacter sp. TaxID=1886636 RepID=UPI0028072A66|nr:response regulator [Luteibacter sp.]MDQ8050861.1 response regulator [Luteibacter sp.]
MLAFPLSGSNSEGDGVMPRILIVDEDFASRQLVITVLERDGWEAKDVPDAASALECFRAQRMDAVLIGELPAYGGLELCRTMRREQKGKLFIVAYTASAQREQEEDLLARGFDHVLYKPVSVGEIQAAFNAS